MMFRFLILIFCAFVLLFGLGCLNYTEASSISQHADWAREYGLPEPSADIHKIGMGATGIGAFLLGFFIKR